MHTARKLPHLAYVTMRLSVIASAYYACALCRGLDPARASGFLQASLLRDAGCPAAASIPGLTKKLCLMLVDYEKDQEPHLQRSSFLCLDARLNKRGFSARSNRGAALNAVFLLLRLEVSAGLLEPAMAPIAPFVFVEREHGAFEFGLRAARHNRCLRR